MTGIWLSAAFLLGMVLGWSVLPVMATLLLAARLAALRKDLLLIALVLAAAVGAFRSPAEPAEFTPATLANATALHGIVVTPPLQSGNRLNFDMDLVETGEDGSRVCASAPAFPVPAIGDMIAMTGTMKALQDIPPVYRQAYAARGCIGYFSGDGVEVLEGGTGIITRLDWFRQDLIGFLQSGATGDPGALLAGFVTGDDGGLSRTTRDAFVLTSASHVTAISGSNFAIVVGLASLVGVALGVRRSTAFLLMVCVLVWMYAIVVGLGAPPLRAAIVATLALLARRLGRLPDYLTICFVAAAIQLAVRPDDLWRLGFQLSFLASLGLVLVLAGRDEGGLRRTAGVIVLASLAAQIVTLPLLFATFGRLSLVSVPVNIAIAPLVAVAFPLSLLAGVTGLIWAPLGRAILVPAAAISNAVLGIVNAGANTGWGMQEVASPEAVTILFLALLCVLVIAVLSRDCRNLAGDAREALAATTLKQRNLLVSCTIAFAATFVMLALMR